MGKLNINLSNIKLKNPIIAASGTFGYGMDYLDFYDPNILGSFVTKGTSLEPKKGNKVPRICEYDNGMLNSVGLENPGAKYVINNYFPKIKKLFNNKVIVNICGNTIEDYVQCAKIFDNEDIVGILEINISCPNVHNGGIIFGKDITAATQLISQIKNNTKKPIYVKCSPQCENLVKMCMALEKAGADGLVLLNTYLGMRININSGKPILANTTGGVSGAGIFPQSLYHIYEVYPHINIPIIGCGGISSAENIIEMIYAGASAVQIGTQNLLNPMSIVKIIKDLDKLCEKLHIENISKIVGKSH